jgi:hypothetical protein
MRSEATENLVRRLRERTPDAAKRTQRFCRIARQGVPDLLQRELKQRQGTLPTKGLLNQELDHHLWQRVTSTYRRLANR